MSPLDLSKLSAMRAIVRTLEDKGALNITGLEHKNNRYSRRLQSSFSKQAYFDAVIKRGGLNVSEMVEAEAVAMAQQGDKDRMRALIRDLEGPIEEYREWDDDDMVYCMQDGHIATGKEGRVC